jgi:hypothetical protein
MLLSKGKPMTNYEDFRPLYDFLKWKNNPKKHWINMIGWEIAKCFQNKILTLVGLQFMGPCLLHLHVMKLLPLITNLGFFP